MPAGIHLCMWSRNAPLMILYSWIQSVHVWYYEPNLDNDSDNVADNKSKVLNQPVRQGGHTFMSIGGTQWDSTVSCVCMRLCGRVKVTDGDRENAWQTKCFLQDNDKCLYQCLQEWISSGPLSPSLIYIIRLLFRANRLLHRPITCIRLLTWYTRAATKKETWLLLNEGWHH